MKAAVVDDAIGTGEATAGANDRTVSHQRGVAILRGGYCVTSCRRIGEKLDTGKAHSEPGKLVE